MFALYCILLLVFVYLVPCLALFPKFALHPKLAACIPVLSAGIVYFLVTALQSLHLYHMHIVIGITTLLTVIAGLRIRQALLVEHNYWSTFALKNYGLHFLLFLPFFTKLATHSFDRGDEIYSWNFWAVQHFYNQAIDFSHTGAAYPQLLPKLLSFCYQILGDLQLQLPTKGMLVLFSFSLIMIIAQSINLRNLRYRGLYCLALVWVLFGCDLSTFFDDGYADPLMNAALIGSVWSLWRFDRFVQIMQKAKGLNHQSTALFYLGLSVLFATIAFLAKQPALLWAVLLAAYTMYQLLKTPGSLQFKIMGFVFKLAMVATLLWWFTSDGSTFHQNKGVLILSFEGRDVLAQLWHSIETFLIQKPLLLLLFILAFIGSWQSKFSKMLMMAFFLPSLLLWFLLAAYQLRLGQHLIALSFLIIVTNRFPLVRRLYTEKIQTIFSQLVKRQHVMAMSLIVASFSVSSYLWYKVALVEQKGNSFYEGGRLSLSRYFGQDADWIYQNIYLDPKQTIWVPSRYLYGLFYMRNTIYTPDYLYYESYDAAALLNELVQKNPNYVFVVSDAIIDGPASSLLKQLVLQYPEAFSLVTNAPNRFDFKTYEFIPSALQQPA